MAVPAENPLPPPDITKMTRVQKLAALLIMLGHDSASSVMKHLDEHELEAVCTEMAKLTSIPQQVQLAILREFSDVAVEASTALLGGVGFTKSSLESSVGMFRASAILSRVAPIQAHVPGMQQILEMEARQIFNILKAEQPQTIALILSYLPVQKGSEVIGHLKPELRDQVVERLATLAPTPIEVVEKVATMLSARAGGKTPRALNQTGGVKTAADLLNAIDKGVCKVVLASLEERNPDLGQAIRRKMFTFEDVAHLDKPSLQKILREVDMRDLAIALKTASDKLKTAFLSCLSKRAAETVNEEIAFMGSVKLREIESAQQRIIDVVRQLESEGEIELEGSAAPSRHEALA